MVINSNEEKELIGRLKEGERAAFDELVDIYKEKGFSIVFNMVGNFEDTKDVLQEVFVKIYLNIIKFQEKSRFSTWFYRIAVNCALDFLRKRKKSNRFVSDFLIDEDGRERKIEVADKRAEPARAAMINELSRNLEDSIAKLSEKQKTCFVLKHQNGLKIDEIAQILRCSGTTVKVHLFRAVNNLRKDLSIVYSGGKEAAC